MPSSRVASVALLVLLAICGPSTRAQSPAPVPPSASPPSAADILRPFTAHYAVFRDGKQQGESRMQLERLADQIWMYRVKVEGTAGMARMAGFEAEDVTEFRITDGQPQMLALHSRSHALFKTREVSAILDWQNGAANWSGDLKDDRRAPTRLDARPVSPTLLNLMLALDAQVVRDGQTVDYQMLDRGSAKTVEYRSGPLAAVSVPAGQFQARSMRRDRRDKNRITTAWYSDQLPPTPVRLLQTDDGRDTFELRLLRVE